MIVSLSYCFIVCFFFNDTATTEIYTLSLHDALPICCKKQFEFGSLRMVSAGLEILETSEDKDLLVAGQTRPTITKSKLDRKSTRLNSSHANISYAVFCLKKKK